MGSHAKGTADPRGDFTANRRLALLSLIAIAIGLFSACVAAALLSLIAFFTNLFFFQRLSTAPVVPAQHQLGALVVFVPVVGGLVIGLMARFGSERIRGHGIPEAMEAILLRGSRVEPKLALLKPISAAVSIGSGGPFGAEGPIIMTGGAFGSMLAQLVRLSAAERKALLVAGSAGGMSATFCSPLAAVFLSVELLLFEWKPRSVVPVALASASAAIARQRVLGPGPLFPTPPHPAFIGWPSLLGCAAAGLLAGILSALLTRAVYASEDLFSKLPIHWMWWPAIGAVAVGLGGLVFPQALGVGYDVLGGLVRGALPLKMMVGVLVVKSVIWSVSLGSGTSGGVLAPLLMMGGALGGLEAAVLPDQGPGFWSIISMGAILGGTMRSPLTGVMFAIEITRDFNLALPLLVAVVVAHAFTVLVLKRSILTEKIARRGYHVSREYAVDPLELLFVREVMSSEITVLPADLQAGFLAHSLRQLGPAVQGLLPVVDAEERMMGIVTRRKLDALIADPRHPDRRRTLGEIVQNDVVIAKPGETLRTLVLRMAKTKLTAFPVVADDNRLLGIITLYDTLRASERHLEEEERRERVLAPRMLKPLEQILTWGRGIGTGGSR